jgi:biotin carboxylase
VPVPTEHLLIMGSGDRSLREYALAAMSTRAPLALLGYRRPTWEAPYVAAYACVDLQDPDHVIREAGALSPIGVTTYDERLIENTATVAAALGLPGPTLAAVTGCKDKSQLRQRLLDHGLSPVRFGVATDVEQAARIAATVGYPVVLKPRALSGSIGVVRVSDENDLRARFETAASARVGLLHSAHVGVLIEEYLDGPEFSVDAVTQAGVTTPVVIAEKVLGAAPYFEEVGHIVPARPRPGLDEALRMIAAVHRAAGLDNVVTHTEFRLTSKGPRVVELNARLGGDLIPYLGQLALGVDVAAAVADVAVGRPAMLSANSPNGDAGPDRVAGVTMLYPQADLRVRSVTLSQEIPGLDRFEVLVRPGEVLRLPPGGFLSRLAVAVVTGSDHDECAHRMAAVADNLTVDGEPV